MSALDSSDFFGADEEPQYLPYARRSISSASLRSQTLSEVPSDVIYKARINYGSRWSACKGLLMEYSKSTGIHGVRYIFEVHRPIYEKLCWLALLLGSIYLAGTVIWDTYVKWRDTPVILGFDETLVPVHKIPFPAITICPEIKQNHKIFDFYKISKKILEEINGDNVYGNYSYSNVTQEELEYFASTLQICEADVVRRFANLLPPDLYPNVTQTLVDLSISKNETGPFCKWNGRFYFCDKFLNFVATDEGICYQFNGLKAKDLYRDERFLSYYDSDEIDFNNYFDVELPPYNNISGNWSLDDGYVGQGYNSYPQRTVFSSVRNAFFAFLQGFESNFDYTCTTNGQGYKVFLNSPESVPLTTGTYILLPHGYEVMVSVLPQYVMSDESLHDFIPKKRQCYFNDERYLRFFRFYSQSNCQTECLANFTIAKCGCAKFWMPKPIDTPVCGVADISCYHAAEEELHIILQRDTMKQSIDENAEVLCDCMPACTSLDYNVEISRARYDLGATLKAWREFEELAKDFRASRISVYFKETQFTAIKRSVLFSGSTLIANWGGILGLFMGTSIVSLIEIFYFFTMRLIYNIRKRRAMKKRMMRLQQEYEQENQVSYPAVEALCWLALLLGSIYLADTMIWDTYVKWRDTPVILGFDETLVPVHKIPFPTITICPEIKQNHKIFDFYKVSQQILDEINADNAYGNYSNVTQEELEYFASTLQICEEDVVRRFAHLLPPELSPNVTQTLVDLSISKNDTGPFCKWNGRFYDCHKFLNFVATDEGICYQFNGLQAKDFYRDERFLGYSDSQEIDFNNYYDVELPRLNNISGNWSLDDGYVGQGYNSYPQRTLFASARNAFQAYLQGLERNFDYTCTTNGQGYKVFLNSPESVPLTTSSYILLPHGFEVMVSVLPQYVMSDVSLHDIIPKKRQCYFNDERHLRFFRFYSQSNCQAECLVNFTIAKCGCAKFWMPKPIDTPVCGVADISCYHAAEEELHVILQRDTMQQSIDENTEVLCDCMPACTSLDYNVEISRARYDLGATLKAWRQFEEMEKDFRASRIFVYFKELQFTAIKRSVLFSGSTLIANWGGILGLFMGTSIVSLIEIFYFFTMRLIYNLRKRRAIQKRLMRVQREYEQENQASHPDVKVF